ncbi:MAG: HAMP domain-containing histidine kinase [Clostridiales bacterium]|nr:HAMP domain-containing histidine kinase [Clostridiales bacterium]
MINYKYVYRNNGITIWVFIPIILVLSVINFAFEMSIGYKFIERIICLVISILMCISIKVKNRNKVILFLKNLGSGYLYIAILRFIELKYIWNKTAFEINMNFNQFITYLELLNVLLCMLVSCNKISEKIKQFLLAITVLILGFILFFPNNKIIFVFDDKISQILIYQGILFILFALIIYMYKKNSINNDYRWIIYFSSFILLSNMLLILSIYIGEEFLFWSGIFKISAYFIAYDKLEDTLLLSNFLKAYNSLEKSKKKEIELYKELRKREKALREINTLLEKSENMYYDLVQYFSDELLVFENDILISAKYLSENKNLVNNLINYNKEENEYLKLNFKNILFERYNINYEDINQLDNFNQYTEIVTSSGEVKQIKIDLIEMNEIKKVLVINDVTNILKIRDEIIKLEIKIKYENMKDEFYSNISHELRTPINVIYSALQLKDLYINKVDFEKIASYNKIIKQNCLRLVRTIDNFIDSNKLSENKLHFNNKIYNIVEIIENVILSSDYYMKLKNVKITFDPKEEEIFLLCDKSHIERIMLNILSNSLKYGKYDGNIYVTIMIENNKNIKIEVINDAEAIPEDKLKDIFEKFTKLNNTLSRPTEGSGLGLFLTRGLVELHNGEIYIETGEKEGNTFRIILPYDSKIKDNKLLLDKNFEINDLKEKVDIEFSDIYF